MTLVWRTILRISVISKVLLVKFISNKVFLFSFYHSFNTVTSFLIVLVIAFFPRLFELGQYLVTQCYMLVNFFIKLFLRIGFNAHLPYRCDLINDSGEFSNEIKICTVNVCEL